MRIAHITAGAGHMYCGSCLRDNVLAAALLDAGHDVVLIPTYTPTRAEGRNVSLDRVYMGGINVFLQEHFRSSAGRRASSTGGWTRPRSCGWRPGEASASIPTTWAA